LTNAWIVGSAATPCGRFSDLSLGDLARAAVEGALVDAGVSLEAIDAVFFANALEGTLSGQECIRGQVALRSSLLGGVPVVNVENACASGSSALHLACLAADAGAYETVLVVGAEKMSHQDRALPLAALDGATDVATLESGPRDRSIFMDRYAARALTRIELGDWTRTDLARVVVKNRRHAAANPIAQYRQELTAEAVLASRLIVDPLTLPMCSPIGDAAAALVVTGSPSDDQSPVRVLASAMASVGANGSVVRTAAERAYEQAGLGPRDLDVAEVHDAAASAEIEEYEHLTFVSEGEGRRLIAMGETQLGGRLPVNTSGGLISRGHPVGATGVLQIVELVDQLRGRARERQVEPRPRHALAQNAGGFLEGDNAVAVVTVLSARGS
jgi:acetyl-CoA acyltransferase